VLTVTTPTGITRISRPPGHIDRTITAPAAAHATGPPDPDTDEDPPPF
jgi:hypothetical protein